MSRPRLLDLFCGAGGAAMGYHLAGFEVVGVDIRPQPRFPYPWEFIQADALEILDHGPALGRMPRLPGQFDAIHASPPCQRFSDLAKRNRNAEEWPDLIGPVRDRLRKLGVPYVIENVEGAPLLDPITLCGTMFPGLRVLRHRLFETNVYATPPAHGVHPLVFTHDRRKAHYGRLNEDTAFVQVTGGGNASVANKAAAMGIDWMIGRELNEAIPPAYTRWIGQNLLRALAVYTPTLAGSIRSNPRNNSDGVTEAHQHIYRESSVRRLTPTECARLMGFPDRWACLCDDDPCSCPDGPQYAAYGNAVVTNCAEWIGRRMNE